MIVENDVIIIRLPVHIGEEESFYIIFIFLENDVIDAGLGDCPDSGPFMC